MKTSLAVLALLLLAGVTKADSIWDYQGNTMPGCNCALSGSVTLDSSNEAVAWDFSAGTHELTNLNGQGFFDLGLAWAPLFSTWKVYVWDDSEAMLTEFYGSAFEATDYGGGGYLEGNRGVWTEVWPTAEPDTLILIGVGLVGLFARRRLQARRKQVPEGVWESL